MQAQGTGADKLRERAGLRERGSDGGGGEQGVGAREAIEPPLATL